MQEMREAGWIDLIAVIRNAAPSTERTGWERLGSIRRNFLYALYTRFDRWRNRGSDEENPFRPADLTPHLSEVEIVEVSPRQTKFSDFVERDDLERVRALEPDVLVRFGFRILRGGILDVPRHGVWSFHHGDSRVNRGSMPGFWEVMERRPTTGSMLQVLSEQLDAGRVLERHVGATHSLSVARNKRELYLKTAPMLMDNLRRLHRYGDPGSRGLGEGLGAYSFPLRKSPTNRDMARAIPRLAARWAGSKASHVFRFEQWFLAYRVRKNADDLNLAFYQFTPMLPPRDRFWADPFAVRRDGRYLVYFEEFLFNRNKAHISFFEIGDDGTRSEPQVALDLPYHLSYPHVFTFDGELFMIPESQGNRTVELWRCEGAPDQWTLETVLMDDVLAADATLFERDGRWWMFTSTTEDGLPNRERLELFYADEPTGPWHPHPANPVKRDVRSARPAGNLVRRRGRLIRPAQDCSSRYGAAIALNEITEWTEDTYSERLVERITPDWMPHLLGTHTINSVDDLTIIDGEMLRPRWG